MNKKHSRKNTKPNLLSAARCEFNEVGFHGTDSNKIAKRAGYSPQTFYRWFGSKTEVFLAVYNEWVENEFDGLEAQLTKNASVAEIVESVVSNHCDFLVFRRSLNLLSLTDMIIRAARADSRRLQVCKINLLLSPDKNHEEIAALLFQIERLNDAIAEGEFEDMGFSTEAAKLQLSVLYVNLGIKDLSYGK